MLRLCLKLILFCLLGNVQAEELITSFHSDIHLHPSGQITVTENIEVNVENRDINRGIFRDFPTQYFGTWLTQKQVGFIVQSVIRNGQVEPFHTENLTMAFGFISVPQLFFSIVDYTNINSFTPLINNWGILTTTISFIGMSLAPVGPFPLKRHRYQLSYHMALEAKC